MECVLSMLLKLKHSVSVLKVRMLKDDFLPTWVEGRGEVPSHLCILSPGYSKYLQDYGF